MATRKGINPKLRFEIFKRDNFTCRYCGRTTPQVILEVDHIIPVADGGTNDMENLVTACYECNRGKGAVPLDSMPQTDDDIHERTILLAEREMQLREYNEVRRQIRERQERETSELMEFWCEINGLDPERARHFEVPDYTSLFNFLNDIAAEDIKCAMNLAVGGNRTPNAARKYLYAILWRWIKEGVRYGRRPE
ncbi:hypothetical protein GCM10025857_07110 [Alicyclobacillus contaminans]|uniref:HNH endonuclease n=1 Tax=Alicyclobacillus contaminans TaxID=392016 RepID=UPI0009FBE5DE|nr:HNH endonuclease [Alicyclobacillus contaminans]GMA49354.1 hypothetical protein GCM10025857_07110 [Alicyclobacillus contaminans]